MSDTELCYLSATEALAAFKSRKLSPVDLMGALIARAEAVEPKINAFPMKHFERALSEAKKAEARYMKTDGRLRPLEGIACAIKDETTIKGWRSTFGPWSSRTMSTATRHPRRSASSRRAPSSMPAPRRRNSPARPIPIRGSGA
jgi:Asp-tRNA(Asn)/Glu-tRNA(Gln) amidotransferase A subunit family amidase